MRQSARCLIAPDTVELVVGNPPAINATSKAIFWKRICRKEHCILQGQKMFSEKWVKATTDKIFEHLEQNSQKIHNKLCKGVSFENWMTRVVADAFNENTDIKAFPEIGYSGFGISDAFTDLSDNRHFNQIADLLVINFPEKKFIVCEAAIVLPYTQAKWKTKISEDYYKLKKISRSDTTKLLMVYACSQFEEVIGTTAWDDWFSSIPMRDSTYIGPPKSNQAFKLGDRGQCALKIWEVQ